MAESKELPRERELIEKYMFTLHKEQVKDRRWRALLRVLRASGFVLLMIGFIILASNPGGMPWQSTKAGAPHTAYINIRGEIAAGTLADADHLIPSIQAAFDNPNSQAVVLRINSPGGSPVQAGRIYEEVKALRALHPEKRSTPSLMTSVRLAATTSPLLRTRSMLTAQVWSALSASSAQGSDSLA